MINICCSERTEAKSYR